MAVEADGRTDNLITMSEANVILQSHPSVSSEQAGQLTNFLKSANQVDLALLNSEPGNRERIKRFKAENASVFKESYIGLIIFVSIAIAVVAGCIALWDYGG